MSLRLGLPRENYWLDLAHGVRVEVRPLSSVIYQAARFKASDRLRRTMAEQQEITALGGVISGLPDLEDLVAAGAMLQTLIARELAHLGMCTWEGVVDATGDPAPCSHATREELMMVPGIADEFVEKYTAPILALFAEGKGLPPSLNGNSGEAGTIAEAV
ncbi:MAG: hypothetical protein RLN89_01625 [Parvibaculum sp.]